MNTNIIESLVISKDNQKFKSNWRNLYHTMDGKSYRGRNIHDTKNSAIEAACNFLKELIEKLPNNPNLKSQITIDGDFYCRDFKHVEQIQTIKV